MAMDPAVEAEVIKRCITEHGCTQQEVAVAAEVSAATVSRRVKCKADAKSPGRPPKLPDHRLAWRVLRKIYSTAGRMTVRGLKRLFPSVARSWLKQALRRVKRRIEALRKKAAAVLHWLRPGSVWAADITWLDGRQGGPCLTVRDLASTKTLRAQIVAGESTEDVLLILAALFEELGAPLVLKIDNGPGLRSEEMKSFLEAHGVMALYSPPRTPTYNGGCEFGNGHLKRVAEDLRLLDDPHAPLSDYLDAAVETIDQQLVGRRGGAATRRELWDRRQPCSRSERRELRRRYARLERARRRVQDIAESATLDHFEQASVDRHAIGTALCEMNLLMIRRS